MTYSIVARDADTGEMGVAVQTCYFAVGAVVPWARPGVGAVATQAMTEVAHGPRCLNAMTAGRSAIDALNSSIEADPMAPLRQVGVVGADGSVASATGELCIDHAGHTTGEGFAVQANMMSSPDVWAAMAESFAASRGSLAHRLVAALAAGETAGGDARGQMSAALLVVAGEPPERPGAGTLVDLRVDRSDDPIGDLSSLLIAADGFQQYDLAVEELLRGEPEAALARIDAALAQVPGDSNLRFLRSGALIASGSLDTGIAELRSLLAERPSWEVVIRSFASKGLIALPAGVSLDSLFG